MCDTLYTRIGPDGWFAKNSDREPDEVQLLEVLPPRTTAGSVRCTHLTVPDVRETRAVILSRPAWMWGAEIGVNDAGVVGGNEAVFTRFPVPEVGLTGMDLLRLALERAGSAEEAVEVVVELLGRFPQGGRMGFRDTSFRYASSFLFADAAGAWILETAGPHWATERVTGPRSMSNALTVRSPHRTSAGAEDEARRRGWWKGDAPFDFAAAFSAPFMTWAAGAEARRACTTRWATEARGAADLFSALRDHGGHVPTTGLRMRAPCAHASWLPTRRAGQTTASLVVRLGEHPQVWATGTGAPCLSVFKPVGFGAFRTFEGDDGLFERHRGLERVVFEAWAERSARIEPQRASFERAALEATSTAAVFEAHRALIPQWTTDAAGPARRRWWSLR